MKLPLELTLWYQEMHQNNGWPFVEAIDIFHGFQTRLGMRMRNSAVIWAGHHGRGYCQLCIRPGQGYPSIIWSKGGKQVLNNYEARKDKD